ncbi:DNA-binding protein, partial [Sphingobium chlorophenolicum]
MFGILPQPPLYHPYKAYDPYNDTDRTAGGAQCSEYRKMKKLFQEDVDPVCDELRASGMPMKSINGSLVWTKLGSVGSRSTAYEMVRDWKERRADRSVVQPLVFSEAGRRDLIAAVERIASGELDVERQATATENAALSDEVEALRQERDDLVKALGELESLSVSQTEVIGALGVEVDELR